MLRYWSILKVWFRGPSAFLVGEKAKVEGVAVLEFHCKA
jgi:hypothetical protein